MQLKNLRIPFVEDFEGAIKETDHIIDAIFGYLPISRRVNGSQVSVSREKSETRSRKLLRS